MLAVAYGSVENMESVVTVQFAKPVVLLAYGPTTIAWTADPRRPNKTPTTSIVLRDGISRSGMGVRDRNP
jgi:hypothetical protein